MNKKKEDQPKPLITVVAVVATAILVILVIIIALSFLMPKDNNLNSYSGVEREVAQKALSQRATGPSIVQSAFSVSSVELTELNGKCNDTIGAPIDANSRPTQRYEIALTEMGVTGIFTPKILIHICVY